MPRRDKTLTREVHEQTLRGSGVLIVPILAIALGRAQVADVQPVTVTLPAKPKLICRESDQSLGSHIRSGRRCKTAEEWQQEDAKRDLVPPSLRVTEGQGDALTPKTRPQ